MNRHLCLILTILCISACGDIKIKGDLDDKDIETISEIFVDDGAGNESDNDAATTDQNEKEDSNKGGIATLDNNQKGSQRYFMGTFTKKSFYNDCDEYTFPSSLRAYSHDDFIDFEDIEGGLLWIADLYPDDTFDYRVSFSDQFGKPTIKISCVCEIVDGYFDYYNDQIECACESNNSTDTTCNLKYEKMGKE
ncbi:hypothetical protein BVY03_05870 [bacterium K02(2017)]|nr:hypothetical protein BVY03_05870 [bacterium K02(2017)]